MQNHSDRYTKAPSDESLLAIRVAEQVFSHYDSQLLRWPRSIPVENLAAQWGLEQSLEDRYDSGAQSMGSAGLTFGLDSTHEDRFDERPTRDAAMLGLEKSRYEMRIFGSGFRKRFTIAHELAHVVLHAKFNDEDQKLSPDARERVADAAAGMILLPDSVLIAAFPRGAKVVVRIPLLETLSDKLKVSLSVLVKRIGDASRSGLLTTENGAFIADLSKSRKAGQNLAPRIRVWLLPFGWFLPSNKRLSSLGMQYLPSLFHSTGLYEEQHIKDELTLVI